MVLHGAFSIVTDIRQGMKQPLLALLNDIDVNHLFPFEQITSIHFARFVVLEDRPDAFGNSLPASLVFTTNYDLPFDNHIQQLVTIAGKQLWQIFSFCENFPQVPGYDSSLMMQYLKDNNRKANTFYVGVGRRSVQQIRNESRLREVIESFIDEKRAVWEGKDALFIRQNIIEYISKNDELSWALYPEQKLPLKYRIQFHGRFVLFIVLAILFSPVIIPFVIVWFLIMLFYEIREPEVANVITRKHIRSLVERETGMVQAQFSAMGNLKPGWFRRATATFLLWLTNFLAPYLFSKGRLSGIPTVHFARWLIINEGKQMLFLSNYDGNSESYLRDFIHIAAKQLTLLFSHTTGYPKTRLMVFNGAKDAKGFMEWARCYQTITNVWYSANKNVSVKNVHSNSRIREGLSGKMTEQQAARWLSLL